MSELENNTKQQASNSMRLDVQESNSNAIGITSENEDAKKLSQLKSIANSKASNQRADNVSGIPKGLKSGIENLSGLSMDEVKVHYNSTKPSQIQALAFAQGANVHLGHGQENHLPHELWHVVQQKQGRVNPTARLNNGTEINDDEYLEKEADLMGQKATMLETVSETSSAKQSNSTGAAQLKFSPTFSSINPLQLKGIENPEKLSKESQAQPMTREALNAMERENTGSTGADRKVEIEGNLTLGARFKGLIGKESTYSQFLKLAADFNGSKDVVEKQKTLKKLKPVAREWLKRHEEDTQKNPANENELKKLATITKFINQTTSNHPEIIELLTTVKNYMALFISNPIENRASFQKAVPNYQLSLQRIQYFRSNYPPAINLLFESEIEEIRQLDNEIEKTGEKISPDLNTEYGFRINNPNAHFNLIEEKIEFSGDLALDIANSSASGKVVFSFDSTGKFDNLSIENGNASTEFFGIQTKLNAIDFDLASKSIAIGSVTASAKVFDADISLEVINATYGTSGFDFDEIRGILPKIDYGFFSLDETEIAFDKNDKSLKASTTYSFNAGELPADFSDFKTSGELDIVWGSPEKRYFSLDNGTLVFKLLNQEANAENISYDSREAGLNIENLSINIDAASIKQEITGHNITLSKDGLSFDEISISASGKPFKLSVFSLTPSSYALTKNSAGYGLKSEGKVELELPEYLGITASGELSGSLSVSLSNPSKPEYEIESGSAKLEANNPLSNLSEIIGLGSSTRFEIGADIPVFPGISAVFGIYLELGVEMGEKIVATIEFSDNTLTINAESDAFNAFAEAGVYGGVQAGSPLLIALALLLVAAGRANLHGAVGYEKSYEISKAPSDKAFNKGTDGLTYEISGAANLSASLDIVATALYFFQKRFKIALGEKHLGGFEFTNKKEPEFDVNGESLATKDQLDEHIDASKRTETRDLSVENLLNIEQNYRFSSKSKKDLVNAVKETEKGRAALHEQDNTAKAETGGEFNNVALLNLQFFNQFIDQRCDWNSIDNVVSSLSQIEKTNTDTAYLEFVKSNLQALGLAINLAQAFVNHFESKVNDFKTAFGSNASITASYIAMLDQKVEVIKELERFKKEHLHSGWRGDDAQQARQTNTNGWFLGLGQSKYEALCNSYESFASIITSTSIANAQAITNESAKIAALLLDDFQKKK